PFLLNDLGVDDYHLGGRIFLKSAVDYGDSFRNPDLWGGEADPVSGIHGVKHVLNQFFEFSIEGRDCGGRLVEYGVAVLHDRIDHRIWSIQYSAFCLRYDR